MFTNLTPVAVTWLGGFMIVMNVFLWTTFAGASLSLVLGWI